jgi:integrase
VEVHVKATDRAYHGAYKEVRSRARRFEPPLPRPPARRRQPSRPGAWVELPPILADAIEASLPPRDDRDPHARLFPEARADTLRTAIARACRANGIPEFSPHDLRHRRISVLHRQGRTWAEIAELVGQKKLSITADTYTHVLVDGREVDLANLLG